MAAPLPEPKAALPKPRKRARPPLDACLNCGAPVVGHFCPGCGQETHDQSVALGLLTRELFSEVASFDSKLMRTLVPLLFRPGFLTNEFNAGRRVRYLSPLKMYLVISAVFFLVLSQMPDTAHLVAATGARPKSSNVVIQLGPNPASDRPLPLTVAAYDAQQRALPAAKRDTGAKRFLITRAVKARQSPQSIAAGFITNLPRMMFVLLPAFALLLKISYWRTRRFYVEHLIFALHMHAFVFLVLTGTLLLWHRLPDDTLIVAPTLICLAYLIAAQKRVYGQTWPRTLLAFGWLSFNYTLLLSFTFALTVAAAFLLV